MNEVVRCGIDGMECFPPSHHVETGTDMYINFARQHGLMVTSGSDYHGMPVFYMSLGLCVIYRHQGSGGSSWRQHFP